MSTTTISNCGCCGSQSQSEEGCGDCFCKWIWHAAEGDWVLDGDNSTCGSGSCEGKCTETTKPRAGIHYEGEEASLEDGTTIETCCCEDRPNCDSSLQCKFRWDEEVTAWILIQEESCDSNLPESSTAHTCCPDPPEPAFWPDLGFPPFANNGEIRVTPCQHPVGPQGGIGNASECHCGCRENVFAEGAG